MIKLIKNFFFLFSLIIIIPLMIGCSAGPQGGMNGGYGSNEEGIPFNYIKTFECENKAYDIFAISDQENLKLDINDFSVLKFSYQIYNVSNVSYWTINYYDNYQLYINPNVLNKKVIDMFYENISDVLIQYEEHLDISFETYQDETKIEKEITSKKLDSETEIYVFDMYVSFKLSDKIARQVYTIYIPVKTFLGYRYDDLIQLVYDNNHIIETDYNDFIYSKYIIN